MNTYTTKATAKRGAIRELSKGRGIPQDEVKANFDDLATIEVREDGSFIWRAVQTEVNPRCATPESLKNDEQLFNDNKREMEYTAAGDAVVKTSARVKKENNLDSEGAKKDPTTEKRTIVFTHKSTAERPTKLVWDIAESMKGARRKEVIEECVKQGIAFNTARTQYQQWFTAVKNSTQS